MSKKWKKKFKKQQKALILQQTQVATTAIESVPTEEELLPEVAPVVPRKVAKWQAQREETQIKPGDFLPETTRVKHDIKKITVLVGSIIILLVVATFVDKKFDWILKAADFIFGKLNFS